VKTDPGEALFERYLKANGYDVVAYEPDLGTTKRPDYLVRAAGQDVVVEVESFNTPPMPLTPRSGFVNMTPKLKTVRNKITAGAEQLKGIEGHPLVVVLANPRNSWVPLVGPVFIGALFGDSQVSFTADGELYFHSGRNGRLHVKEPDGSVRGNHRYLSAVAVLRLVYPQAAYRHARPALGEAAAAGNVVIISGGYGLADACEPIGWYDKVLRVADWPPGLLESALTARACKASMDLVVGFAATSSSYAYLLRRTRWRHAGLQACLVTITGVTGGAMAEVPRRLPQAFAAFWNQQHDGYPPGTEVQPLS